MRDVAFSVDVSWSDGVAVVAVRGEVDLATAPNLAAVLNQIDDTAHAALNLSAVDFMDSTGLHVVLVKAEAMRRKGGALLISSVSQPVRQLLRYSAPDSLLAAGITG